MENSQKHSSRKTNDISLGITPDIDNTESEANSSSRNESLGKKRKRFSFYEKAKILNGINNERDISAVCAKYEISERTLRDWRKDKNNILEASKNKDLKDSRKKTDTAEFDNLLYAWLLNAQAKGIRVTGPILKQKALSLSKHLGRLEFKASEGWIEKWKKRKSVRFSQ